LDRACKTVEENIFKKKFSLIYLQKKSKYFDNSTLRKNRWFWRNDVKLSLYLISTILRILFS
jgi:hypothetical protein